MKRIFQLTRNQLYLSVHQISFWIGILIVGGYAAISFIYHCFYYYGYDSGGTAPVSELFIFHENNPFWYIFSMLIPFLGLFAFSMQPIENKENHINYCMCSRVSKKEYYISGALCSMVGTFLMVEVPALFGMALYHFTFAEAGEYLQGAKYSNAFWRNIKEGSRCHLQKLNLEHPWLHVLLFSVIFSVFCSVLAFFFFACGTLLKKEKLWMLLLAGIMSFAINQFYQYADYDIYGDVVIAMTGRQSGIPTIIFGMILIIAGAQILHWKCRERNDE